ncbi:MAG: hypothetical protein HC765_14575 [Brachymonas sp.]|nr:hypothetical protein [Brachymonas sp.]
MDQPSPIDGSSFTPELAQCWGDFWAIEWFDIQSYEEVSNGKLLAPSVEDFTNELVCLAKNAGVKFTVKQRSIRVWGYIRSNNHPVFS